MRAVTVASFLFLLTSPAALAGSFATQQDVVVITPDGSGTPLSSEDLKEKAAAGARKIIHRRFPPMDGPIYEKVTSVSEVRSHAVGWLTVSTYRVRFDYSSPKDLDSDILSAPVPAEPIIHTAPSTAPGDALSALSGWGLVLVSLPKESPASWREAWELPIKDGDTQWVPTFADADDADVLDMPAHGDGRGEAFGMLNQKYGARQIIVVRPTFSGDSVTIDASYWRPKEDPDALPSWTYQTDIRALQSAPEALLKAMGKATIARQVKSSPIRFLTRYVLPLAGGAAYINALPTRRGPMVVDIVGQMSEASQVALTRTLDAMNGWKWRGRGVSGRSFVATGDFFGDPGEFLELLRAAARP